MENLSDKELYQLQTLIENLTTQFDDFKNIYQISPDLIKIVISNDKPSAKDFIKSHKSLSSDDLDCLDYFDQYTLEAIMLYVISYLFSCINEYPAVRVSTLIDHLNMNVKTQAKLLKDRNIALMPSPQSYTDTDTDIKEPDTGTKEQDTGTKKRDTGTKKKVTDKKVAEYAIGSLLVEFLVDRKLIILSNELNFIDNHTTAKKIKGKYYYPKTLFATCNFDLSLLPIKLNLPMVYAPVPWKSTKEMPKSLSDIRGGYLNMPSGDFYHRYSLLTSRDMIHFHIVFENDYKNLCDIMSLLQGQAFEINKDVLNFIKDNYDLLVKSGLLMPRLLASLNVPNVINLLRKSYLEDPSITQVCKFQELLNEFMVRIQRARYEVFIIDLASAYEGYRFYLPAFLDFRGRIYRAGVLHFHERDIARSLIAFSEALTVHANTPKDLSQLDSKKKEEVYKVLTSAAAFHYKKFTSYDDAHQWYLDQRKIIKSDESLIQFAVDASDPYQFISKVLCIEGGTDPIKMPITQDASASAYQIMSFLLLDKEIATLTNLIPYVDKKSIVFMDQKINDIYSFVLESLKDYLSSTTKDHILYNLICSGLTRKLIKRLFMPLVYGKTMISMSNDIYNHYSTLLGKKESVALASSILKFFKFRFPGIVNLMALVSNVAWIPAALEKPVFYSIPLLTSVQDYMKFKNVNIWVYDRIHKKRRQVSLRIPTENRDRRKTHTSTFANFIHQKDANIAMFMILEIMKLGGAPVYTVHDNFITAAPYAMLLSNLYLKMFSEGRDPLYTINSFITRNLLDGRASPYPLDEPLPLDYLKNILVNKIPKNLSKQNKLIWNKKVESIYAAYKYYLITSCGYDTKTGESHYNTKLNDFKENMLYWDFYKYKYSLHL